MEASSYHWHDVKHLRWVVSRRSTLSVVVALPHKFVGTILVVQCHDAVHRRWSVRRHDKPVSPSLDGTMRLCLLLKNLKVSEQRYLQERKAKQRGDARNSRLASPRPKPILKLALPETRAPVLKQFDMRPNGFWCPLDEHIYP